MYNLDNRIGEAIRYVVETDCEHIGQPAFRIIVSDLIDEYQCLFEEDWETLVRIYQIPAIKGIIDRCNRWDDYAWKRRDHYLQQV